MARRITTISLDDVSYQQAQKIGNLSAFVREQLQIESDKVSCLPVDYHNNFREHLGICYPYHPTGYCGICWPYGRPSKSKFREWNIACNEAKKLGKPLPEAPMRLADRRPLANSNQIAQKKSSKTISDDLGIIRRLWRWFF